MYKDYLLRNKLAHKSLFSQLQGNVGQLITEIKKNKIKVIILNCYSYYNEVETGISSVFCIDILNENTKILKLVLKNLTFNKEQSEDMRLKELNLKNYTINSAEFVKSELERYFLRIGIKVNIDINDRFELVYQI